ncbi:MAG: hypothetical protein ACE5FV_03975 [Woeseia sp.]
MGTEEYIDTDVLPEGPQVPDTSAKKSDRTGQSVPRIKDVRLTRVGKLEVDALSIDDGPDSGGDPYNRTGKHCRLKPRKD